MPCFITVGHYIGLSLGECIGEGDRTSEVTIDRGSAILDNHTTNGNNKYHSKITFHSGEASITLSFSSRIEITSLSMHVIVILCYKCT